MDKKFKRISRIAKGETVLVPMIAEDLQDLFDKTEIANDDYKRASEEVTEDPKNIESAKKLHFAKCHQNKLKNEFWTAVHERYGHWEKDLGMRDGYALVEIPEEEFPGAPPQIADFLKQLKRKMLGGDSSGGFQIGD